VEVLGRGSPAFGGARARGPVRRISVPEDVLAMLDERAEGVIAVVDDAGATFLAPIYGDLAGVVCLSGSPGSHLAIISREFGIPALMACTFDDGVPADGRIVEIDTDTGTVVAV
jgi:phosphoenolpyruvate-protein kinase (PTS system EI component)